MIVCYRDYMSIPQLFYLGMLASLLHHIPGMDLGTMVFALHYNNDFYATSFKKSLMSLGVVALGYIATLFVPLTRLDPIIYYFSETILGFFLGFIFYAALYLWFKSEIGKNIYHSLVACILLSAAILLKAYQIKIDVPENMGLSFLQGFTILIPGIKLNFMSITSVIEIIFVSFGILGSLYFLRGFQKRYQKLQYIVIPLILSSLCDFWPWRSFQTVSYSLEGAQWVRDYPVMPEGSPTNILLVITFFIIGIISSWVLTKTYSRRIILVHE